MKSFISKFIKYGFDNSNFTGVKRVEDEMFKGGWIDTHYLNGKKHGLEKRYSSNGEKVEETSYKNGFRSGVKKTWHRQGSSESQILASETHYLNGELHGLGVVYNSDGSKRSESNYEHGLKSGIERHWYNQCLLNETNYLVGKKHGFETTYNSDGLKTRETWYEFGVETGVLRGWDKNGELEQAITMKYDRMHGLWKVKVSDAGEWEEKYLEFDFPPEYWTEVTNPEFIKYLKPHYKDEPIADLEQADRLISQMGLRMCGFRKMGPIETFPVRETSLWGYVNIIGENETWPERNGRLLSPILQIKVSETPGLGQRFSKFSWITLFAEKQWGDLPMDGAFVLRTYKQADKVISIDPPSTEVITKPQYLDFGCAGVDFPDDKDLPPNLAAFYKQSGVERPETSSLLRNSHTFLGGWPKWRERLSVYGKWRESDTIENRSSFLFQIYSDELEEFGVGGYEVEGWGQDSVLYFFEDPEDICSTD